MERRKNQVLRPAHRRRVGMRIVKTVVAVFLCGVLACGIDVLLPCQAARDTGRAHTK